MKSIRLSLVLYFLVLLAGALGAVSVLAYRTAEQSLQEKQKSVSTLLRTKHEAKLDELLLQEARTLANFVKVQTAPHDRRFIPLQSLGLLPALATPAAVGAIPLWGLQGCEGPLRDFFLPRMIHTRTIGNIMLPDQEGQLTQFVQVNGDRGAEWRSSSLGRHALPFDPREFSGGLLVDWKFDNGELAGKPLRRVTLKVSRFRIDFRSPSWMKKGGPGRRSDSALRVSFAPPPFPSTLFIQGAYDTSRPDGVLGRLQEEYDHDLARLEQSAQENLQTLGKNLLAVSMLTFAATLLGIFSLVRLGLLPLRRLSDAVSQVSAKDFRLPLDGARMPYELRPIVERLQQTLGLLGRAFAREKQAAADISHELRTPLAALLTTLDVALRKPRQPEEYRELMEECRSSGQHMYGLVERLLTLARLDAGVDHLRPREVDLGQLAEQCALLVRPLAEARGLSIRLHRNGPACLTADPDKLREVVTNLLHNAIEYNRPDGSIDVAVERQNGDVRVEVRDTGIGISPEARQHLFERFYRADPSRAADGLHAGLGLAIVKGYVDLMGGAIDVESTEGQGSTFRVRLPVRAEGARV